MQVTRAIATSSTGKEQKKEWCNKPDRRLALVVLSICSRTFSTSNAIIVLFLTGLITMFALCVCVYWWCVFDLNNWKLIERCYFTAGEDLCGSGGWQEKNEPQWGGCRRWTNSSSGGGWGQVAAGGWTSTAYEEENVSFCVFYLYWTFAFSTVLSWLM